MPARGWGGAAAVLLAACAGGDEPGARARGVTNGTPDDTHQAVAAIVTSAGGATACSGVIIERHTMLTAAHCGVTPGQFGVVVGPTIAGAIAIEVAAWAPHPEYDPATGANDLGLVTLRQAAPVLPLPLDSRVMDSSFVGMPFQVVGFGVTTPTGDDAGIRRSGTSVVSAVREAEFESMPGPAQACAGDSGGAALFDDGGVERVGGIVSSGDPGCVEFAVYARVDGAITTFIEPYLAATAPGTAGVGEPCLYDEQCVEGRCLQALDEPSVWFCSPSCATDGDCPGTMECVAGDCRLPLPSPGAPGWPCASAQECVGGICHDDACTRDCLGMDVSCPEGFACTRVGSLDYYCLRAASSGWCGAAPGSRRPSAWIIGGLLLAVILRGLRRRGCDSVRG